MKIVKVMFLSLLLYYIVIALRNMAVKKGGAGIENMDLAENQRKQ